MEAVSHLQDLESIVLGKSIFLEVPVVVEHQDVPRDLGKDLLLPEIVCPVLALPKGAW